jgi:hypothetical protein
LDVRGSSMGDSTMCGVNHADPQKTDAFGRDCRHERCEGHRIYQDWCEIYTENEEKQDGEIWYLLDRRCDRTYVPQLQNAPATVSGGVGRRGGVVKDKSVWGRLNAMNMVE